MPGPMTEDIVNDDQLGEMHGAGVLETARNGLLSFMKSLRRTPFSGGPINALYKYHEWQKRET